MNRRWAVVVGVVVAGLAVVPLATAWAEGPATTAETPTAPEGSVPPGGTVDCTTGATLDPTHGPPGTVVTVTATFQGNCDDVNPTFLADMVCTGEYRAPNAEGVPFPMTVDPDTGDATGTFTAPVTEPDPPVVDAVEPVLVTVTCTVPAGPVSPPSEGPSQGTTTYQYPESTFDLELFADPDSDQPTFVDNDQDDVDDGGVVEATPPFTG